MKQNSTKLDMDDELTLDDASDIEEESNSQEQDSQTSYIEKLRQGFLNKCLKIDPADVGLHLLIVNIHGLPSCRPFWYTKESNIFDLQQFVRTLFETEFISDSFKIAHQSCRFDILNTKQESRLRIKIKDLDISPNFIKVIPEQYLVPIQGGGFTKTKRGKKRKLTQKQRLKHKKTIDRRWKENNALRHKRNMAQHYIENKERKLREMKERRQFLTEQREKQRLARKKIKFKDTRNSFRIEEQLNETDLKYATHYCGAMDNECRECGALMFEGERLVGKKAYSMAPNERNIQLPI